jgi:hypothetical protein
MSRIAFTVVRNYYGQDIEIKSIANGKTFRVKYSSPIAAEIGDTVSVLMDNKKNWKTIINERTGNSSTVSSVY